MISRLRERRSARRQKALSVTPSNDRDIRDIRDSGQRPVEGGMLPHRQGGLLRGGGLRGSGGLLSGVLLGGRTRNAEPVSPQHGTELRYHERGTRTAYEGNQAGASGTQGTLTRDQGKPTVNGALDPPASDRR